MANDDKEPDDADALTTLAQARFGELTTAEKRLLEKAHIGEIAVCGPSSDNHDPTNDPKDGGNWGRERQISAELVAWLCTNQGAREQVHSRGMWGYGAVITGSLDLAFVSVPFPVRFQLCHFEKPVDLSRANLPELDLRGSLVHGIMADRIAVNHSVFLGNGFAGVGQVSLYGARIGGDLNCGGGSFTNPPQKDHPKSGWALFADAMKVEGSVFLGGGFIANGEVRLLGSEIGRNLDCSDGRFTNQPQKDLPGSGRAFSADGIKVSGGVLLRKVIADGHVRLVNSQIGGSVTCDDGTFTNPYRDDISGSGDALSADGINVNGVIFLSGVTAKGQVRLVGAQIGGYFDCSGGTFTNSPHEGGPGSGAALDAERIVARAGVFLRDGFTADGAVNLHGSQMDGPFTCRSGNFQAATVYLNDTIAKTFEDSGATWPAQGQLLLDGFVYDRIHAAGERIDVDNRLAWLNLQPRSPFRPRPYLQLAKVLRESGDTHGSLRVLQRMEELRRSDTEHGPVARLWSLILKLTIGYGYYPQRAIWALLVLSVVGWAVYAVSYTAGTIAPSEKSAYDDFKLWRQPPAHYPGFSPLVYSVENSLPLVKLGQADKWQPDPATHVLVWVPRVHILFGWFFAIFFVAGVSGIVHKE